MTRCALYGLHHRVRGTHSAQAARSSAITYPSMHSADACIPCFAGNYDFERYVLSTTDCSVNTFDCTYAGASQGPGHSYYKWCVGDPKNGPEFRSWANITATLGHSKVDMLKIDIGEAGRTALKRDADNVLQAFCKCN